MNQTETTFKPSYKAANRLKLLLSTLQRISPKLAYNMAIKVFFTPIKFPTPERELPYKHSARLSREIVNGKRITLYQTGQSNRSVLLVHGWSGRASQFYKMAPAIQKTGYKVFSFTAPAHGSATEKQTHMLEFADCIKYIDEKYGPFEAIIGHSIGGTAMLNAINKGVKTKKGILIGTPGYVKEVVDDFCSRLGLNQKVAKLIINHIKRDYAEDYEQFSATRIAEQMTIPALILHDVDDKDVSINQARENHKAWKSSKLIETKGLGHRFILASDESINYVTKFLAEN